MDGAKKTLLASAITILLTGSVAAYAGMISVPGFSIQIPTPTPSSPPAAGQNMSVPSIPSGTQIPAITQPPAGVAALPSIAKSGQPGAPIYGNPSSSTDSTGSAGTVQNLAGACQASGGAWNPSTATCVTNTGASFPDQCVALGGQFNYTTSQCQMASLPGIGGGGWQVGKWSRTWQLDFHLEARGSQIILQKGNLVASPAGTCQMVNTNTVVYDWSSNSGGAYCSNGQAATPATVCDSGGNSCSTTYSCPANMQPQWSNTTDSCSTAQLGQTRPAGTRYNVNYEVDVTNQTSFDFGWQNSGTGNAYLVMPSGIIFGDSGDNANAGIVINQWVDIPGVIGY